MHLVTGMEYRNSVGDFPLLLLRKKTTRNIASTQTSL